LRSCAEAIATFKEKNLMASTLKNNRDYNYYRIMCMIEDDKFITYRKIAKLISVSTGSAYNLMTDLIKNGYVNVEVLGQEKNRQKYLYNLSSIGVRQKAALAKIFLDLKQAELEKIQNEIIILKNDIGYVSDD
jgi:DNA-binding PadR family transcriptional regulator